MGAGVLDGGVQVDAAPIDAGPARLRHGVDDLRCGDRAEQPAFLACLGRDHDPERFEMGGYGPGLLEIGDLSGDAARADALGLAHRARRGEPRQVAGQQVVAPVAVGDLHDIARGADPPDLLTEDDLHVVDLALANGVGEQRHLAGVLDRRCDVALMLCAVAADPSGADLAAVAHELPQQVHVLVVDVGLLVSAELAELPLGLALERALWHTAGYLLAEPWAPWPRPVVTRRESCRPMVFGRPSGACAEHPPNRGRRRSAPAHDRVLAVWSSDGARFQNGGSSLNWPLLRSPPPREARSTLAVANFRLGATSSASTSVTERFSPSGVSQERVRRRPTTTARLPLVRDSATFSAICRQTLIRKNDVSPSFQLSPSRTRGVTASLKLATAAPLGVNRSSGSSVRLPTRIT